MHLFDNTLFTLLDPEEERRSAIASLIARFVKRVVPHGQLDQLMSNWPLTGILLVYDSDLLVVNLQDAMRARGLWRSHVVFGEGCSTSAVVDAVVGGAIDYVTWPIGQNDLLERMVLWPARSSHTGPHQRRRIRARKRIATLTSRETDVLRLMMTGRNGQQVATQLNISERTIEIHRGRILKKLNVSSAAGAVRLAVESELWLGAPLLRWRSEPAAKV